MLPTVLLGLRTAFKPDIGASAAEMLYGTALTLPGEFFVNASDSTNLDTHAFADQLRKHIRSIRPRQTTHHTNSNPLKLKDLFTCSHVFLRTDAVKRPLETPYTGPYEIIKRINESNFVIMINEQHVTVSTERLKPAYCSQGDELLNKRDNHQPTHIRSLDIDNHNA